MEPCIRMFAAARGPSVVGSREPSGAPNATPASFESAINPTSQVESTITQRRLSFVPALDGLGPVLVFSIVVDNTRTQPVGVTIALALGITAVVTVASWYLVERPFLRWKDRLEPRDHRRLAASESPVPQ